MAWLGKTWQKLYWLTCSCSFEWAVKREVAELPPVVLVFVWLLSMLLLSLWFWLWLCWELLSMEPLVVTLSKELLLLGLDWIWLSLTLDAFICGPWFCCCCCWDCCIVCVSKVRIFCCWLRTCWDSSRVIKVLPETEHSNRFRLIINQCFVTSAVIMAC